jgi:hypothetical protein
MKEENKIEEHQKMVADHKAKLPQGAACKSPDFKLWDQCPEDCPFNSGVDCELPRNGCL